MAGRRGALEVMVMALVISFRLADKWRFIFSLKMIQADVFHG